MAMCEPVSLFLAVLHGIFQVAVFLVYVEMIGLVCCLPVGFWTGSLVQT